MRFILFFIKKHCIIQQGGFPSQDYAFFLCLTLWYDEFQRDSFVNLLFSVDEAHILIFFVLPPLLFNEIILLIISEDIILLNLWRWFLTQFPRAGFGEYLLGTLQCPILLAHPFTKFLRGVFRSTRACRC